MSKYSTHNMHGIEHKRIEAFYIQYLRLVELSCSGGEKQVFRIKSSWGCRPNSKYLLPSVTALSLTIGKHDIVS